LLQPLLQFFGALAVGVFILLCTAVVMTERPVWMVGEVRDLSPNKLLSL
jgi:hypothetical protein